MKKFLLAFLALGALISCDKIEDPLKDIGLQCGDCEADADEAFATQKNVLIEEFTGITCNNCPKAATEVHNLISQHPERVYTVAIHASNFAVPNPPEYPSDFRTEVGNDIFADANPIGVPSGLVNRFDYGTQNYAKLYSAWSGEVDEILQQTAEIGLLAEVAYDSISREICLTAKFKALRNLEGRDLRWSAFLTESHIIAPQKMPDNSTNKDYEHNHVLRASLNGTWGSEIADFSGTVDEVACQTAAIGLDPDWKVENMEIVLFVYETGDNTKEVLQVVSVEL